MLDSDYNLSNGDYQNFTHNQSQRQYKIIIVFNIISRTHGVLHNLTVNYSVTMRKINACNNQCNCSAKERFNGWYRSDK